MALQEANRSRKKFCKVGDFFDGLDEATMDDQLTMDDLCRNHMPKAFERQRWEKLKSRLNCMKDNISAHEFMMHFMRVALEASPTEKNIYADGESMLDLLNICRYSMNDQIKSEHNDLVDALDVQGKVEYIE